MAVVCVECCDCCGRDVPTPYEYACLPHVRWDRLCVDCADEVRETAWDDLGVAIPVRDPYWYLRLSPLGRHPSDDPRD
jgi:hypothetical protein